MKPERKISTGNLARVMYILAVGMVIILTGFLLCTDNVIRYQARQSDGYQILTDLEDSQYEDESAPIGIVQDHSFIYEGDGDTLAFYTVHQYVEVWMEDTLIYSLKPGDGTCIETIGSNWNVLSLTDQDHGKRITIRIMPVYRSFISRQVDFLLGDGMEIYADRLMMDMPQIVLSIAAIIIGVLFIATGIYMNMRQDQEQNVLYLGMFSLMLGIWRICDTRFTPFVSQDRTVLMFYFSVLMLMVGTYPIIQIGRKNSSEPLKIIMDVYCIISSLTAIIQIGLQLAGIVDIRESLMITHVMIAMTAVIMVINYIQRWKSNRKGSFVPSLLIVGIVGDVILFYVRHTSSGLICTLSALIIFLITEGIFSTIRHFEKEKKIAMQERELMEGRISTMMSQIRPHFVYNTLGSIEQLCEIDSKKAQQLVHDFSCYLRGYFSELDQTALIPLSKEISHTEYYASIEKVRFPDIDIVFAVQSDDFLLPALTIQPLVENAIRHGLMKRKQGGTVIVTTWQDEQAWYVRVKDDGVGFDVDQLLDEHEHIGIRNIRERLSLLCHAMVNIESEIGKGTEVTVIIPFDGGRNESDRS